MKVSKQDRNRLEKAARFAENSDHKYRIGALLYSGGRLIGWGANKTRMVDMEPFNCCMVHAEESALSKVDYSAPGSTIYVARINALNQPRLAIPCHRCIAIITAARVSRIVWTEDFLPRSARTRDIVDLRNKSDKYRKDMGICRTVRSRNQYS